MSEFQDAESIVRAAQAALAEGNAPAFVALLSPDVKLIVMGTTPISGTFVGAEAILGWFAKIAPRIASASAQPVQCLNAGRWMVTWDRVVATTVAGRAYRNDYARLWRCEEGLCVEIIEFLDTEAVTQALLAD
jgi:ketosteroid isomerase-like protein